MAKKKYQEIDFLNKRFKNLLVIGISNKPYYLIVKCDCGKIKEVRKDGIKRIKSCGCARIEVNKRNRGIPGESSYRYLYKQYKVGAKHRNYVFNLPYDIFKKLIISNCYYCGIEPYNKYNMYKAKTGLKIGNASDEWIEQNYVFVNGVDRIDNSKNYDLDNVVSCCKICNQAKYIMSIEEFDNWIKRIHNFRFGVINEYSKS